MSHQQTSDTLIKIFYGSGWRGLEKLQEEVNEFIYDDSIQVLSLTPSACAVGNPHEEIYQAVTITLWYRHVEV